MLVHKSEAALLEACRFEAIEKGHALDHLACGTANIDRLTARTQRGRAFDNGYVETSSAEPERQGGTGNARA
jgi:hypothetical protein